jgi:hypothetical protein
MKIYACPKCGSKNIHIGTMDSGVTYGITSWDYTCKDCNYKGMPLIFYSEKEYQQFLKGLKKEIENRLKKDIEKDENNLTSKEDKEILKSIKELIDEESNDKKNIDKKENPNWHNNRTWWIEIIIAFSISGLITIFGASIIILSNNATSSIGYIIYLIIEFFIQAIFILAIIVGIEYFILFKFIKK